MSKKGLERDYQLHIPKQTISTKKKTFLFLSKINLSLSRIRISCHHESNKFLPIYSSQQPHRNTQNSLATTSVATNHYFGNHNEQISTTKNNRDRGKTTEGYKIHWDSQNMLKPIAKEYWINRDKLKYIENNHHQDPKTTTKKHNNTKIGRGWLETNIDFPLRTTMMVFRPLKNNWFNLGN